LVVFCYMLTLMSEAVSIAAPSPTLESASQPSSSRETRCYLLAALFSAALVSGVGQLFLGQRRKGSILLMLFSALLFGFWPVPLLLVMGDGRDISLDSRSPEFGLVENGSIVGKPWFVFGSDRVGRGIR
jgi:TM2 domain-containing membrane protein YozV